MNKNVETKQKSKSKAARTMVPPLSVAKDFEKDSAARAERLVKAYGASRVPFCAK